MAHGDGQQQEPTKQHEKGNEMKLNRLLAYSSAALALMVSGAAAQDIDAICKLAADEPQLVVYSVALPARNEEFFAAFNAQYPDINVQHLRMTSGQTATRYASERAAGVINADVVYIADAAFIEEGVRQGWFAKFDKTDLPALAAIEDRFFDQGVGLAGIQLAGIMYNTEIVGEDGIQTWEDILKPELKGQIAIANPRTVPSNMAVYRILHEEYGDEFFAKLAAQEPAILDSVTPGTQQVAAGGLAIALPGAAAGMASLQDEGAPIGWAAPEPATGYEYVAVISEGSDSPNAARCLYNYMFTEDGQRIYMGTNGISTTGAEGTMAMPERYIAPNITAMSDEDKNNILRLLTIE